MSYKTAVASALTYSNEKGLLILQRAFPRQDAR